MNVSVPGYSDSFHTSRILKDAAASESCLRNLQKFKEYAPKVELAKITKARKLFEESKLGPSR